MRDNRSGNGVSGAVKLATMAVLAGGRVERKNPHECGFHDTAVALIWQPRMDSNHRCLSQSQVPYRLATGLLNEILGRNGLALRELRGAACLVQADLLALDFAGVAGHEASLAQFALQRLVVLDQRAGNAEADRAGLAGVTAAFDRHQDVELVGRLGQLERLAHDHARGFASEEIFDRTLVDGDLAVALAQEHACGGRLAAAGAVILGDCHVCQISSGCGCWEACGWLGPAYTLSLRYIARPSGFFGNMPLTAVSITRSGCRCRAWARFS